MALYVNLMINDKLIQTFGAQNITPHLETTCTYRLCKYVDGKRVYLSGVIYHKRSDGAVVLAKKLLDFAIESGEDK